MSNLSEEGTAKEMINPSLEKVYISSNKITARQAYKCAFIMGAISTIHFDSPWDWTTIGSQAESIAELSGKFADAAVIEDDIHEKYYWDKYNKRKAVVDGR